MRPLKMTLVAGVALFIVAIAIALSGSGLIAQEPTPEGSLGGRAPLDATIPVGTAPPTSTPDRAGSPTPHASPAGSPVASPAAGEALAPVACGVAPRALDEVAALLMLAESPATPPAATVAEWTPDAQTAAKAVAAELVACGNAGNQLAAYALLTDAALVDFLVGSQPPQNLGDIRALFFTETPSLVPALVTGLETRAGEPGVVYLWLDLGMGRAVAATLAVTQERGAWRISAIRVRPPT